MTISTSSEQKLFTNSDVMKEPETTAFTSYYLAARNAFNNPVLELKESVAGIVMAERPDQRSWMKSKFQSLAKSDASSELLAQARADFGVSNNDELLRMRTVGCGTSIVAILADGIHYITVERTAPKNTANGANNPGAYSRAAGGSTGNIDLSSLRELNEELFIVVKDNGKNTALNILPQAYQVDRHGKDSLLQDRRERFSQILDAHGSTIKISQYSDIDAPCIDVTGLTEDVIERTQSGDKVLSSRVFSDSPHQLDVNGVDAIAILHLPHISSYDIVGLYDGETNQKGDLLKRKWSLQRFEDIYQSLKHQEIIMSPAPAKVVQAKDLVVVAALTKLGL